MGKNKNIAENYPDLSVVIGIRDWDIERVETAVTSHLSSSIPKQIEIIISDYGSKNHTEIQKLSEKLGCIYVHTDSEILE